jgi:hypothetical protein
MFTTSKFAIVFFLRAVSYQPSASSSSIGKAIMPALAPNKLKAES